MPLAWGETIRRAALRGQELPTMNVTMLKDRVAYPDGVTPTQLAEGETYELRDDLARRLVDAGYACAATGRLAAVKKPEPDPNPVGEVNVKDAAAEPEPQSKPEPTPEPQAETTGGRATRARAPRAQASRWASTKTK